MDFCFQILNGSGYVHPIELANSTNTLNPILEGLLINRGGLKKLGAYLNHLDDSQRTCDRSDGTRVETIQSGIERIVERLTTKIARKESMFRGKIQHMGSYYDGLKVGAPDEFDFMFVLDQFSHENGLQSIALTNDPPGFAAMRILPENVPHEWPVTDYCLEHEQIIMINGATVHRCRGERVKVLDPYQIQNKYRHVADEVMLNINLPPNWCHGGFNRPHFSGHRRHGPATLFQFVYKDGQGEIKVTIDMTLAIRLRMGVDLSITEMSLLRRFPLGNQHFEMLLQHLQTDPGMHVIPLYSKFLIQAGHASKKYNWKVSGSCSEKIVFQSLSNLSLMKKLIRVLKILRDKHLTYYRRKTERKSNKHRRRTCAKTTSHSASRQGTSSSVSEGVCQSVPASDGGEDEEDDTTDLTEVEDKNEEEATLRYRNEAPSYQKNDIGFDVIDPKPGSGEYWGARHYISSVEIKTLVLSMLLGELKLANYDGRPIDYTAEADDETLALLTVVSISFFNNLFIDRRQMKYLYFDTALCSLLSDMKTENARRALHNIIEELLKNSKS